MPDLSATIEQDVVLPTRKIARRRAALRIGLASVGAVQLGIAAPALGGDSLGMAMAAHAAHEGAAWNLAIAVAFLAAAWRPRRAAGLIPLLGTFIAVLAVLSVHDVVAGEVGVDRLATHAAAVIGLVLLWLADRSERALPPNQRALSEQPEKPPLRGVA